MKKMLVGMLAAGVLVGSTRANAQGYPATVTVDGKEWRQLTETVGFSWNQVAGVCDSGTGLCSGAINAVSFDGWTWAGNTDIQSLFNFFLLRGGYQLPTSTSSQAFSFGDLGGAMLPGSFQPTLSDILAYQLSGVSRTLTPDKGKAYQPILVDWLDNSPDVDGASLSAVTALDAQSANSGVWLFKTVPSSTVPEPGTVALLGLGLAGLVVSRRRRTT